MQDFIGPTLALEDATSQLWDVIVVGAGPAGSLAARETARLGATTLLIDKDAFPRYKVCGGCLSGHALAALARAGLGELVKHVGGVATHQFCWAAGGRTVKLPLSHGMAISRETLDAQLVREAICSGAAFLPQSLARLGPVENQIRCVSICQNRHTSEVKARIVLAADGISGEFVGPADGITRNIPANSYLGAGAQLATAPPQVEPGVIYMACADGGYVGATQVENGQLDMAAALDATMVKKTGGLGPAAAKIVADAGLARVLDPARFSWRGTPNLTRSYSCVGGERVFAIGDAAGYVEPFTGEGIGWAMSASLAVAPLVCQACERWEPTMVQNWSRTHRATVARRQRTCRMLRWILRRPRVVRSVIGLLNFAPGVARPFVRSRDAAETVSINPSLDNI